MVLKKLACSLISIFALIIVIPPSHATDGKAQQIAAIKQVIALYTQGTYEGDTDKLSQSFHKNTVMNGSLRGKTVLASPQRFIDSMGELKMSQHDTNYQSKITHIEVDGNVASVTLKETGFPNNTGFTNYFHLINDKKGWKIISKAFQSH